jgi:hypothetical protein
LNKKITDLQQSHQVAVDKKPRIGICRMRISLRLILGFLAVAMWVAVVGHISLYQLNQIADPLSSDIPESGIA